MKEFENIIYFLEKYRNHEMNNMDLVNFILNYNRNKFFLDLYRFLDDKDEFADIVYNFHYAMIWFDEHK